MKQAFTLLVHFIAFLLVGILVGILVGLSGIGSILQGILATLLSLVAGKSLWNNCDDSFSPSARLSGNLTIIVLVLGVAFGCWKGIDIRKDNHSEPNTVKELSSLLLNKLEQETDTQNITLLSKLLLAADSQTREGEFKYFRSVNSNHIEKIDNQFRNGSINGEQAYKKLLKIIQEEKQDDKN